MALSHFIWGSSAKTFRGLGQVRRQPTSGCLVGYDAPALSSLADLSITLTGAVRLIVRLGCLLGSDLTRAAALNQTFDSLIGLMMIR